MRSVASAEEVSFVVGKAIARAIAYIVTPAGRAASFRVEPVSE